jgi:hypothetical protein
MGMMTSNFLLGGMAYIARSVMGPLLSGIPKRYWAMIGSEGGSPMEPMLLDASIVDLSIDVQFSGARGC